MNILKSSNQKSEKITISICIDEISIKVLKSVRNDIFSPLDYILNLCHEKVISKRVNNDSNNVSLQKGDMNDLSNYRPVA